jgi:hypothetical protein
MIRFAFVLAAGAPLALPAPATAQSVTESVAAVTTACAPSYWHSAGAQTRSTRWTFDDGSTIDATLSRRRCEDGSVGLLLEFRSVGHLDLPCGPFEVAQGERRVRVRPVDAWGREHLPGHCPQLPGQPTTTRVTYLPTYSVTPPESAGIDLDAPLTLRYAGLVPGDLAPLALPRTLPVQTPGSLTGFWTERARNGEGWAFELAQVGGRDVLYTSWLHHEAGAPRWLVGFVDLDAFDGERLPVDLYETAGPGFGDAFDAGAVTRTYWGGVELAFDGCDAIDADWLRRDGTRGTRGTQHLVRVGLQLAGTRCSGAVPRTAPPEATRRASAVSLPQPGEREDPYGSSRCVWDPVAATPHTRALPFLLATPDARVTLAIWRCGPDDVRISREVLDARVPVGTVYAAVQDGVRLPVVSLYATSARPPFGAQPRFANLVSGDETLHAQGYRFAARDNLSFPGKFLDPSRAFVLEATVAGTVFEIPVPAYTPGDERPLARGHAFTGAQSGLWSVPGRDGEAWFVEVGANAAGKFVFVTWLTYEAGRPVWLVGSTPITPGLLVDTATIELHRVEGAQFGAAFRPADVRLVPWGTLTLSSQACTRMTVQYARTDGRHGSFDATRYFERLVGNPCTP